LEAVAALVAERDRYKNALAVFDQLTDDYGADVRVVESSDVGGHVWVFVAGGSIDENKGSSLLNPTQARRLAVALLEAAAYIEAPGEARRREQELRADLTQARSALQQIRDYVLLEYQEGDKPFQLAILAVTALDETQDPWQGVYPGMCVDPEICRGYGHCPRPYSCSE
jgi:hypothetical protein